MKSLLKNSIEIQTKVNKNIKINEKTYSLVEIKFLIQNILETAEIKSLEIAILDEENEFTWVGNRKNNFVEKENVKQNFFNKI